MNYGGGAGAAAANAIANAIKASGAIIRMDPDNFLVIVERNEKPLVVVSESGFFQTSFSYLTAYRGLIFYTKTRSPLLLKSNIELVYAKKIWIPG